SVLSHRTDYLLDISLLGLAEPFEVIPHGSPVLRRTVEQVERAFDYRIGGAGRYAGDRFLGGNPWSLSAIWLALYHAHAGRREEAFRWLDWCLDHAARHDLLPEQSDRETGEPVGATPLGWSHAWMVVLLQYLGGPPR